jgi:hypothetical protein
MHPHEGSLTRDQLITYAGDHGWHVTRHQLLRWQLAGLLPKPQRHGLGRGRGVEVRYDGKAPHQLVALCTLRERYPRSLRKVGWGLWVFGHPVTTFAREVLDHELSSLDRLANRLVDLAERQLDAEGEQPTIWELLADRRPAGVVSAARRRIGRENWPAALEMLFEFAAGRLASPVADHVTILAKGLTAFVAEAGEPDIGTKQRFARSVPDASRRFAPVALREAIAALTDNELEALRIEAVTIHALVSSLLQPPVKMLTPTLFLTYFALRRLDPTMRDFLSQLLDTPEWDQVLRREVAAWQSRDPTIANFVRAWLYDRSRRRSL